MNLNDNIISYILKVPKQIDTLFDRLSKKIQQRISVVANESLVLRSFLSDVKLSTFNYEKSLKLTTDNFASQIKLLTDDQRLSAFYTELLT